MITTKDDVVRNRGDKVWAIGVTVDGVHVPFLVELGAKGANYLDEYVKEFGCWKDYDLCNDRCKEINKSKEL